jgi:hybrid cluster-associated redox disulfide protein
VSHHDHIIRPDMTIAEVLRQNPKTAQVLMRNGMHCLGCATANGESIAQAALAHGIELETLLRELNEA